MRYNAPESAAFVSVTVNTFARGLEARPSDNFVALYREGDSDKEYVAAIGHRNESYKESASKGVTLGAVRRAHEYIENSPSDGRQREVALTFFVVNYDRTELTVLIIPLSLFDELLSQESPVVKLDSKYRFDPREMDLIKDHPDVLAAFRLRLF